MSLKQFTAIFLGKLIFFTTRFLKIGGGSAAPGYYALKIDPNLVKNISPAILKQVVITGTNGKTTTARFLTHFAHKAHLKVIRNQTGSNLERGVASSLIANIKFRNLFNPKKSFQDIDLAIWELDEAAFNQVSPKLHPNIIIFLNIFRDQLDRYGEVNNTLNNWSHILANTSKDCLIILNNDDNNLNKLRPSIYQKLITFGLTDHQIVGEKAIKNISVFPPQVKASNIKSFDLSSTNFDVKYRNKTINFSLPIPGTYHIYDFLAAFISALNLGIIVEDVKESLNNFSPAFGRVEKVTFPHGKWEHKEGYVSEGKESSAYNTKGVSSSAYIFLIKNPIGATEVLQTIGGYIKKNDHLLLALNDNLADGTDVSWIWDMDFAILQNPSRAKSRDLDIICSGKRAEDMALRVKYSGIETSKIVIEPNLEQALDKALNNLPGRLFILPTYTALLELQKILAKKGIKKHYWKEN